MILHERYFKMSNAIFSYELTPIQYAVYSYLISLAGNKEKCWPSMKRIAACCHCSKNAARAAVDELEHRGFIRKVPTYSENRHGSNLEYRDAAANEMLELAQQGDPYAQHTMGTLYRDGDLLIPDIIKAQYWFGQAATQGIVASQYVLGKLLLSDDREVHNLELGIEWLKYAFENGSHHAGYRLGKEYLRGEFVEKDVSKAIDYLTFSAGRGHQQAQYLLGKMYLEGREVEQDTSQAQHWLTLSAQQGNNYAAFFLARMNTGIPAPSLILATTRLMQHIGNIFQDNTPPSTPVGIKIEPKLRQKLREKRLAMGIKDEPEQGQQLMG